MPLNFGTTMAGNIGVQDLPTATRTKSNFTPAAGIDVGSNTQLIGDGADETVVLPTDITGHIALEVWNLDSAGYIELSTGTGGTFAAQTFAKIFPGFPCLIYPVNAIKAKATSGVDASPAGSIRIQIKFAEIS
jgi:hypothetical protein